MSDEQVQSDPAPVKKVRKPAGPRVSNEDYVRAYKAAASYESLAASLGQSKAAVEARARKLRKAGVQLAPYASKRKAAAVVDVEALNAIVSQ